MAGNKPQMEARIAQLEAKVAAQERQIAELLKSVAQTRALKVEPKKPSYNFAADEPILYRWSG